MLKIASAPAGIDTDILADDPTQLLQALRKGGQTDLRFRVV